MNITIIAAVAQNGAIGKDNKLLWHLPADMRFFKETTWGHPIITGRKNYESIPSKFRPLRERLNIVVTRQTHYEAPGATVVSSLEEAVAVAEKAAKESGKEDVFIIGGGMIYSEALQKKLVNRMLITRVNTELEADTFFPLVNESEWSVNLIADQAADDQHAYSFQIVELTSKI